MELHQFDTRYIQLLRRGDRATQAHFAEYFGHLLRIKLRSRQLPTHVISDVQQETFVRVLVAVRTEDVRQPERLGAYVNSVCNNVLLEHFRESSRDQHEDLDEVDAPDAAADLEARMLADERKQRVHAIMSQLSARDRAVLQAILLDRDKDEVCRELAVDRGYLRVLTHRAMGSFKEKFKTKKSAGRLRTAARR